MKDHDSNVTDPLDPADPVNRDSVSDSWGRAAAYDAYADGLHTYALGGLRHHEAASSAVYCAFVAADHHVAHLGDAEMLRPWLYAITRHYCRAGKLPRLRLTAPAPAPAPAAKDAAMAELERTLLSAELASLDWPDTDGLSAAHREVLELSVRHGMESRAVGMMLGKPAAESFEVLSEAWHELERSLAAVALLRTSRSHCPDLAALAEGWSGRLTAQRREPLVAHVDACSRCQYHLHKVLGAPQAPSILPHVQAPKELRDRVLGDLLDSTPEKAAEKTAIATRLSRFDAFGFPAIATTRPSIPRPHPRTATPMPAERRQRRLSALLAGRTSSAAAEAVAGDVASAPGRLRPPALAPLEAKAPANTMNERSGPDAAAVTAGTERRRWLRRAAAELDDGPIAPRRGLAAGNRPVGSGSQRDAGRGRVDARRGYADDLAREDGRGEFDRGSAAADVLAERGGPAGSRSVGSGSERDAGRGRIGARRGSAGNLAREDRRGEFDRGSAAADILADLGAGRDGLTGDLARDGRGEFGRDSAAADVLADLGAERDGLAGSRFAYSGSEPELAGSASADVVAEFGAERRSADSAGADVLAERSDLGAFDTGTAAAQSTEVLAALRSADLDDLAASFGPVVGSSSDDTLVNARRPGVFDDIRPVRPAPASSRGPIPRSSVAAAVEGRRRGVEEARRGVAPVGDAYEAAATVAASVAAGDAAGAQVPPIAPVGVVPTSVMPLGVVPGGRASRVFARPVGAVPVPRKRKAGVKSALASSAVLSGVGAAGVTAFVLFVPSAPSGNKTLFTPPPDPGGNGSQTPDYPRPTSGPDAGPALPVAGDVHSAGLPGNDTVTAQVVAAVLPTTPSSGALTTTASLPFNGPIDSLPSQTDTAPSKDPGGQLHISVSQRSNNPGDVDVTLWNSGTAPVGWTATTDARWLHLSATSGMLAGGGQTAIHVLVDSAAEPRGPWTAHVRFDPSGQMVSINGDGGPGGSSSGPSSSSPPSSSTPSSPPSSTPGSPSSTPSTPHSSPSSSSGTGTGASTGASGTSSGSASSPSEPSTSSSPPSHAPSSPSGSGSSSQPSTTPTSSTTPTTHPTGTQPPPHRRPH